MARVFITGSADGLGQMAAEKLIRLGHNVVLHARNAQRVQVAIKNNPGYAAVLTGDLSNIEETKKLADEVYGLGTFDAVIHNAGVYQTSAREIFAVNTLAPYILTSLIQKPKRLIYLSSGMHLQGRSNLRSFKSDVGRITYADSKLHVMMLCKAVARMWSEVYANVINPGWVPTKMGGRGAPDDLQKGGETQVWLAVSNEESAKVSGRYFFHQKERPYNSEADSVVLQEEFLKLCKEITGVTFPQ
jgi:NAD(P)-dependent dehydrogenase (short-subunit alcohol dehydrogenase family)